MTRQQLAIHVFCALAALGLAVAGASAMTREMVCAAGQPFTELEQVDALLSGHLHPALSDRCAYEIADLCFNLSVSVRVNVSATARRNAVFAECRNRALDILAGKPTHSFAWLVEAAAAAGLGDAAALNQAIIRSRLTAPNAGWLARRRTWLGEAHFELLSEEARSGLSADIGVSARTPDGTKMLADLFLSRPETRERITSAVELLAGEFQYRFLDELRRRRAVRGLSTDE
jgi:hypothetical protein